MTWLTKEQFELMKNDVDNWDVEIIADVVCSMKNQTNITGDYSIDLWFKVGYVSIISTYQGDLIIGKARPKIYYTEQFLYDTLGGMFTAVFTKNDFLILDASYWTSNFAIWDENQEEIDIDNILDEGTEPFNTVDYGDVYEFITHPSEDLL